MISSADLPGVSLAVSGVPALEGYRIVWKDAVIMAFWVAGAAAPTAPMWLRILGGHAEKPLLPIAAALLAAVPLAAGFGVLCPVWIEGLPKPYAGRADVLMAVLATPVCALLIGFAAASILVARDDTEVRPVFRATVAVALVAWIAVALVLTAALCRVDIADRLLAGSGEFWGAGLGLLGASAWIVGLWRVRNLPVERILPILSIMVLLIVTFVISWWFVGSILSSNPTYMDFKALLMTPLVLGLAVFCALVLPVVARSLARLGGPPAFPA